MIFSIGDLVGKTEGEGAVQIRIYNILEDGTIVAIITKLDDFYSSNRLNGGQGSHGFVLGETLIFEKMEEDNRMWWIINYPSKRPWFILEIYDEIKKFEHYR